MNGFGINNINSNDETTIANEALMAGESKLDFFLAEISIDIESGEFSEAADLIQSIKSSDEISRESWSQNPLIYWYQLLLEYAAKNDDDLLVFGEEVFNNSNYKRAILYAEKSKNLIAINRIKAFKGKFLEQTIKQAEQEKDKANQLAHAVEEATKDRILYALDNIKCGDFDEAARVLQMVTNDGANYSRNYWEQCPQYYWAKLMLEFSAEDDEQLISKGISVVSSANYRKACMYASRTDESLETKYKSLEEKIKLAIEKENNRIATELEAQHLDDLKIYDIKHNSLIKYKNPAVDIVIPEYINSIENSAFANCENIGTVSFPNSISKIGEGAFQKCTRLQNIVIPSPVAVICKNTFLDCVNLTDVTIPNGTLKIGECAFANCQSLKEIVLPESITEIKNGVFQGCTNLQKIVIPSSVTIIYSNTFRHCRNLSSIIFPDELTEIGEYAFANCQNIVEIILPDGLTTIREGAFKDCPNLEKIVIPNSVGYIGRLAFDGCTKLKYVSIPSNCNKESYAFMRGCTVTRK